MTCPACAAAAQDWRCARYDMHCPDCVIRNLANAPKVRRQLALDKILKKCGAEAHRVTAERIKTEYLRIQSLKGKPS